MAWQFNSARPIYQQIVDAVELGIFNGVYPMGERLPSVRELAQTAAVNPNTMQRALSELEKNGLISTQRTTGRTVTTDQTAVDRARAEKARQLTADYLEEMDALGADPVECVQQCMEQKGREEKEQSNGSENP